MADSGTMVASTIESCKVLEKTAGVDTTCPPASIIDSTQKLGTTAYNSTLKVNIKNTFIETEDDVFDVVTPWRRHATEPDTGGTKSIIRTRAPSGTGALSMEALPSLLETETEGRKNEERWQDDDGANECLKITSQDWRRTTTDCSWDGFETTSEWRGVDSLHQQQSLAVFDAASSYDGVAPGSLSMMMMPAPATTFSMGRRPMAPYATTAAENASCGDVDDAWKSSVTTVMIKNLHNRVTQQVLLDDFNTNGFDGSFDFAYLPIDPETNANRGYAFVNFLQPHYANEFKQRYEDTQIGEYKGSKSGKFIKVTPATLQGFAENYAHYSTARVQRARPEARPLFFRELLPAELSAEANKVGITKKGKRSQRHSLIDAASVQQKTFVKPKLEAECSLDRFCTQCGGRVASTFKFCSFCGVLITRSL